MNDSNQPASPHYLPPEQLRVGIFIELELTWFKHNFARSAFKIKNEAQLQEVLALRLPRYRYDPDRSDAAMAEPSGHQTAELTPQPQDSGFDGEEPAVTGEQNRQLILAQREQKILETEKAFIKAASLMKNFNRTLVSKPKEALEDMDVLVQQIVSSFLDSPEITLQVIGERAGGEDVYYHALNVTILAMMLAKELELSSEVAHELCIGAITHDIGLMKIPDRITRKDASEYTSAERNLRAMHVDYGIEIGQHAGLSPGALAIIAQHHEFADGSGYPKGIRDTEMTPAARIVSLVNYYDNLCNPVDISKAMTPHDALSLMFAQRRGKFESRTLALLIRSLGVYPPGTIVQLSNEAVAVVISVNPQRSLRPCVLVYSPQIPKDQATLLDLENEPAISISKAIKPASLPQNIITYLCPRKRVTYFFDSSSAEKVQK